MAIKTIEVCDIEKCDNRYDCKCTLCKKILCYEHKYPFSIDDDYGNIYYTYFCDKCYDIFSSKFRKKIKKVIKKIIK